jgi:ABC-2 type transport system permease protein
MRASLTIATRDFKGFFGTAMGWIAAFLIFLSAGIVFFIITSQLLVARQGVDPVSDILQGLFSYLNYIYIFVVPVFTMRVMSDELGSGVFRIQASAPISSWEIVLGKFLGIMFYFATIALLMLTYPAFVFLFSEPDVKVMLTGWLGNVLHIGVLVSISLFVASLTKNSVIAYLGAAIFILLMLFSTFFPAAPEWYRRSLNLLELGSDFGKGMVKTSTLAIYMAFYGVFLFLSRLVVESKRWRF